MKFHHASGMNITSFYKYCTTQIWLWENSEVVCCLVCSGIWLYLENMRNKVQIVPSRDDTFSLFLSVMNKKIGLRHRHFNRRHRGLYQVTLIHAKKCTGIVNIIISTIFICL